MFLVKILWDLKVVAERRQNKKYGNNNRSLKTYNCTKFNKLYKQSYRRWMRYLSWIRRSLVCDSAVAWTRREIWCFIRSIIWLNERAAFWNIWTNTLQKMIELAAWQNFQSIGITDEKHKVFLLILVYCAKYRKN